MTSHSQAESPPVKQGQPCLIFLVERPRLEEVDVGVSYSSSPLAVGLRIPAVCGKTRLSPGDVLPATSSSRSDDLDSSLSIKARLPGGLGQSLVVNNRRLDARADVDRTGQVHRVETPQSRRLGSCRRLTEALVEGDEEEVLEDLLGVVNGALVPGFEEGGPGNLDGRHLTGNAFG